MVELTDLEPSGAAMLTDVIAGLSKPQKELPCKYLYDAAGSRLYDEICELEEYYPARTEMEILRHDVGEMAGRIGPGCMLIEFGSGSSEKTRILLANLVDPAAYVPVDISREQLLSAATRIDGRYPELEVMPVVADYTRHVDLPAPEREASRRVVYFPGSTIGNFDPDDAVEFLGRIAGLCGEDGGLLIGVDLQKDTRLLEAAYDDRRGVTAAFNLNILSHLNRELGSDFDPSRFEHRAIYDDRHGRVEMHLVSLEAQAVSVNGERFDLAEGEWIWTESSYKYTLEGFAELAERAGFEVEKVWTDSEKLFSVQYLCGDRHPVR